MSTPPPTAMAGLGTAQVSSALNLWLPLKSGAKLGELMAKLAQKRKAIDDALTNLHYVHFARFVASPDSRALQVITAFDGEFEAYVLDFVLAIGDAFDIIMEAVEGAPTASVRDDPAAFLRFIRSCDLAQQQDGGGVRLYSAYPQQTVIDIVGASGRAPAVVAPEAQAVDRSDVQANLLRGVNARHAWHAGFRCAPGHSAHALLVGLLAGTEGLPRLSNDAERMTDAPRPPYWLTLGFTYDGLLALGIGDADQAAFELAHPAFVRGPHDYFAARANGDHGSSDPAFWQLGNDHPVDLLLSLYADEEGELSPRIEALKAGCATHGLALVNNRDWRAQALTDPAQPGRRNEHFGYADGVSQPRLAIQGEPEGEAELQPRAGVGEFLLGGTYRNVYGGKDSLGGLSPALANNASFAALRILAQDVAGFEQLLDEASARHDVGREWLAAKLMGRWRDGRPLSLSPDAAPAAPGAPLRNDFDYLPSADHPGTPDDSAGLRCPIGAHARRMNPRSARVAGMPHSRRLLRRGMPYGPRLAPGQPDDGQPRGLIGLFLCADLDRQYEFMLRQWAQGDRATSGIRGELDPILGTPTLQESGQPGHNRFSIPRADGQPPIVLDLPQLVTTVGSAYLFMPGLAGVRHLAGLAKPAGAGQGTAAAGAGLADPQTFDPRLKAFRDDPFPTYAAFRAKHPVAHIATVDSLWAFSDRAVAEIANDPGHFVKRAVACQADQVSPAGLLHMDGQAHDDCRQAIEPLFAAALMAMAPEIPGMVATLYQRACQGQGQTRAVDWVAVLARPLARQLFFRLFGLTPSADLVGLAEAALALVSPRKDAQNNALVQGLFAKCGQALQGAMKQKQAGGLFDAILQMNGPFDRVNNQPKTLFGDVVVPALHVERMANATTMVMAGILPVQWFVALACWRLLQDGGRLLAQLKAEPAITDRAAVAELLRYDMSTPMSDRYATEDGRLSDGTTYPAGQRFTLVFASANRDAARFGADADAINFKRDLGSGWALGPSGTRSCLGGDLVYQAMEPLIRTLREADPVPRLQDGFSPAWGKGALFRPMQALMVHG